MLRGSQTKSSSCLYYLLDILTCPKGWKSVEFRPSVERRGFPVTNCKRDVGEDGRVLWCDTGPGVEWRILLMFQQKGSLLFSTKERVEKDRFRRLSVRFAGGFPILTRLGSEYIKHSRKNLVFRFSN